MLFDFSGTIVVYNPVFKEVCDCVDSFFLNGGKNIAIIDSCSPNSDKISDLKNKYKNDERIVFLKMEKNYGFGSGHNFGFKYLKKNNLLGRFYGILNPDLILQENSLKIATEFLDKNDNVSILSPQILNTEFKVENLNKEFPNVFDMFLRRFFPKKILNLQYFKNRFNKYIRLEFGYDKICEVPFASGACLFLRSEIFEKLQGFDERFFLYMEDADFSKRAWNFGKVIYNPDCKVVHIWKRESSTSLKMTIVMLSSMVKYFNKNGWKLF